MFRLTNKLAVSNLIKNRKLYYPFALAVLLAVTVTYLFYSLTFNPKIAEIRGGTTIQATLVVCLSSPLRQPLSFSMPIVLS
ncbi:ABC transporter, membrane-spanning protein [Streptococcus pneumoniae]|nr:ABC transporter, membrane-spanning protein [Streptococcus pneumoniae]VNE59255.1 ABC transporter, membrane-spanning protein [Streptococcus pneumoniae]